MVHYFNPGHEAAVLNKSPYYMPPVNVLQMQYDLAYLPAWYALADDLVFMNEEQAGHDYLSVLKKQIKNLPQPVTLRNMPANLDAEVCFWGITPQAIHVFDKINREKKLRLMIPAWHDEYLYLNSRLAAKDCLESLIKCIPEVSSDLLPCFCRSIDEVKLKLKTDKQSMLAKAPYSSSGRGIVWLNSSSLKIKEKEMLSGIIKKQQTVSLEFALNKKIDFAMQFLSDGRGSVQFEGFSLFETDNKGAYSGNFIYSQEKITRLLTARISFSLLENVKMQLISILKHKYASLYKGCIGVDMMLYEKDGQVHLHPCVEINMRYNMGYLALQLYRNYLYADSKGKLHIEFNGNPNTTYKKHLKYSVDFPLIFKNGKIQKGYLSLCPVSDRSKYHAYIACQS